MTQKDVKGIIESLAPTKRLFEARSADLVVIRRTRGPSDALQHARSGAVLKDRPPDAYRLRRAEVRRYDK